MSDDDRLEQLDYYTLLGVERGASVDDVKRAFRTFARKFHPDRFAGAPQDKVDKATRIYRRGSEAVQTLTDLEARKAYDAGLAKGELRLRDAPRSAARAEPARPAAHNPAAPAAQPIRSPAARAYYARAQESVRAGDLKGAWKLLKSALEQEPDSALIEAALHKVEGHLRGR
jgi:curved DNA-binding protein CbpA